LAREARENVFLPSEPLEKPPYIIILKRSQPATGWINNIEILLKRNRQKLLWTLAQNENKQVSCADLADIIYGADEIKIEKGKSNALASLIKNTRLAITEALREAGKEGSGEDILIESCEHYMLKGRVVIKN
jgi:hypothetical protein